MDVLENIKAGKYVHDKLKPVRPPSCSATELAQYFAADTVWWECKNELHRIFREDLYEEFGVVDNPKRWRCFDLAWEYGHGTGLSDVYYYFDELVELIK